MDTTLDLPVRLPDEELLVKLTLPLALVCALGLTLGVGCPREPTGTTLPVVTTDDPEAEASLRDARELAEAGELERAEQAYRAFLARYPGDALVPIAKLGLGRILLATTDADEARALFAEVATHDDPRVAERGAFYEGVAMHLMGEHQAALERLEPMVGRTVDPEESALLLTTIAAASERLGDPVGSVVAYDRILGASVPEAERARAQTRLDELIEALDAEQTEVALSELPTEGRAWPIVARRALRNAFDAGRLERVRQLAEALESQRVPLEPELRAMVLRANRTGEANPRAIGAILPLSGRGREIGQRTLQALMLAANLPPRGPTAPDAPRVHFRDDAGDPERAARAVDDLVALHQVIAIVGPLDGRSAEAAAARAQALGVPLLSLAPDARVTRDRPMVFRMMPTAREEAAALVRAAKERGAQRIAAIHPTHAFGTTMARSAREAAEGMGLAWGGEVSYEPGATSFGDAMTALRRLDFDALIVPDTGRTLAVLAPSLAAGGIWGGDPSRAPRNTRPATILLPTVSVDAQLLRTSARYLEGALVSRPYEPTTPGAPLELANEFEDRYGEAPDVFAAAAYDAFHFVEATVDRGALSRDALAGQLGELEHRSAAASGGLVDHRPRTATRIYRIVDAHLQPLTATD